MHCKSAPACFSKCLALPYRRVYAKALPSLFAPPPFPKLASLEKNSTSGAHTNHSTITPTWSTILSLNASIGTGVSRFAVSPSPSTNPSPVPQAQAVEDDIARQKLGPHDTCWTRSGRKFLKVFPDVVLCSFAATTSFTDIFRRYDVPHTRSRLFSFTLD